MTGTPPLAPRLALLSAGAGLIVGGAAFVQGVATEVPLGWGFGLACLLQVAPSLALGYRIREGLGNRGLDGERRTLRITSHLLRLLALVLAMACAFAWTEGDAPKATTLDLALAGAALLIWLGLWAGARKLGDLHPSLALNAARARTLAAFAGLWLAGGLLGLAFPWGGPAAGLLLAGGCFAEGRTLAKATTVSLVGCGGCGSCGCG